MDRLINVSQAKDMFGSTHILYEAMKRAGVVAEGKRHEKKYSLAALKHQLAELYATGWSRKERAKQYEKRDGSAPVYDGDRVLIRHGKAMTDEEFRKNNIKYPYCRPCVESFFQLWVGMKQHVTHCRGTKA